MRFNIKDNTYLVLFIILAVLPPLHVLSQSTNGNGVPTINAVYTEDEIQIDGVLSEPIWESAVHINTNGWIAELRIPFSQLRYNSTDTIQSWGVNFSRRRIANNEHTYFALESRLQHGKVSVFGALAKNQIQLNMWMQ